MTRYLIARLFHTILVLVIVATFTFAMLQAAPGGPSILMSPDLAPEDAALIRANLGLDQPVYVQYARWIGGLARFDLGRSFNYSQPVIELIANRLPATLLLSASSLLLALVVAIPLGMLAARRQYSLIDQASTVFSLLGLSIPNFWLAIMLILLFSVTLRLLPSSGMVTAGADPDVADVLLHLLMPSLVLGLVTMAQIAQYTRSTMLGVLRQDYVRTARAKGLREARVLFGHALRNALVPIVTVVGVLLPRLVGGAVITETIFAWPGMGRLAADAAFHRDYPVVMGVTLVISTVVVLSNLLVDLLYGALDPRIRLSE